MTVKLNGRAYEHAKRLIEEGQFIDDEGTRGATIIPLRKSRTNLSKRMAS